MRSDKAAVAQTAELKRTLERLRAESERLSAELAELRAGKAREQEQLTATKAREIALEEQLCAARRHGDDGRRTAERLLGALQLRRSYQAGAERYRELLEHRLEKLARNLSTASQAIAVAWPHVPSVIAAVAADIARLRRNARWWKVARAFSATTGNNQAAPRTVARKLERELTQLRHAVSEPARSVGNAAETIIRLLDLRERSHRAVTGSTFSALLGEAAPGATSASEARFSTSLPSPLSSAETLYLQAASSGGELAILFDSAWYLDQNPDVGSSGLSPVEHFARWGAGERRNPNPLFYTGWYLERNAEVVGSGMNPLLHYVEGGGNEGRDPCPLFDSDWYLAQNADLAATGGNPLAHFVRWGAAEERDPHPLFRTGWYRARNPEIEELNPLEHYLRWGGFHGRNPHPLFDSGYYLAHNPDIAALGVNPLDHYLEVGGREARNPHPLFISARYLAENPDVAEQRTNTLRHYVEFGAAEGRAAHPLFDSAWYRQQYRAEMGAMVDPLEHYVEFGFAERLMPNPVFDTKWYAVQYGLAPHEDPLRDYVERGAREGRDPHPLFASRWYVTRNFDAIAEGTTPLQHYLEHGAAAGRNPHPLFDTSWYLQQNPHFGPDAAANPVRHYVLQGAKERRSPHPMFDAAFYAGRYPEAAAECENLLVHYLSIGWKRGWRPSPDFDPTYYLRANRDVAEAGLEPLSHYVQAGHAEGRKPRGEGITFSEQQSDSSIPREPMRFATPVVDDVRAIAFYLPQFHTIPENDRWWGEGFTEWRNVRRGTPNYEGHYQPHVPSTLGYYDLRDEGALQWQAALARQHGIHGFCLYYYWFAGTVLLDLPLRKILESSTPDIPFCLCWANENWTRRWDGKESEILIAQHHSPEDDRAFIERVEPLLLHRNYVRVHGRPLLAVYRASLLPNALDTTNRWREHFRTRGNGELHLVMVRSFSDQTPPEVHGFDAAIQFPPHFMSTDVAPLVPAKRPEFTGHMYDYNELKANALRQLRAGEASGLHLYGGVMPSWDNTARQGPRSTVWLNTSPESYYEWISETVELVKHKPPEERLLFINAWNEWAEGCHLEPDARYGHAWLNATAMALCGPAEGSAEAAARVAPPVEEAVAVAPLPATVKLDISVLFYHREDIIPSFLRTILLQIEAASAASDVAIGLYLGFNYKPAARLYAEIETLIAELSPTRTDLVRVIEHGFNLGFGAGHNSIFSQSDADLFLMVNSDVRLLADDWLSQLIAKFRDGETAIVGLAETASKLREDGCGIPVTGSEQFDFVDGSALAIRSDLARRFGLFSDAFDYFYFEDVDLCLRYRQMGLRIELLDLPYEHERSSSSRLLPKYSIENVLGQNRARFFHRWGNYLRTRRLPNRLAIRFAKPDRELQCAALPALFGLLADHPTAIIDISGVHEQLVSLFAHPRLRLIASWQTMKEQDYLRFYEIAEESGNTEPLPYVIAEMLGCAADFKAAREHLVRLASAGANGSREALVVIARKDPLFDGKQPAAAAGAQITEALRRKGYAVGVRHELANYEVQSTLAEADVRAAKSMLVTPAVEILRDVAGAEVVVSADSWVVQLAQLLAKKTFGWFGARSAPRALWRLESSSFFVDSALPCLGCYHHFGTDHRNTCLRGDVACMRSDLLPQVIERLERFLAGEMASAAELQQLQLKTTPDPYVHSEELDLGRWPRSRASSVLVLTPIHPKLPQRVIDHARHLAERATEGMNGCRIVFDPEGESPPRGVPQPHRQDALAAIRQGMIDRHLRDEQWVFWVDADIVDYPADLIDGLIARAEGGIAAPLVIMQGDPSEPPSNKFGFGPGRFYDVAGFAERGRWARFHHPYFDQLGPVYQLDSVGSCYLVNADLYRHGAKHMIDPASAEFVRENRDWPDDSIAQNQQQPANCFTEHYTVCAFARSQGLPVQAFADLIAWHERA
ncbi:MAG: glycoside hydrolase family 99-like domain-containing protein [Chthoniobacterales bacterium]|nr:glycoside hydrolase family 99-like domain-containing protein [Chthoniobacterales bacterium]